MHCVERAFQQIANSNEYLLAKFGFDTAENERCKVCPLSAYRSPRFLKEAPQRKYFRIEGSGGGQVAGSGLRLKPSVAAS